MSTVFIAKVKREGKGGKTYWQTVGRVNEGEKGLSMKLDCIPVGNWNGWISLFAPDDRGQQKEAPQQAPAVDPEFDDDVPF